MNENKSRKVLLTGCKVIQAVVPAKRRRHILCVMCVLLLGSNSLAQSQTQTQTQTVTGDWVAVRNLMPGTRISVKAQHRYRCSIEEVTDDELVCRRNAPRWSRVTLVIPRSEIREVRIRRLPNQAKDAWIGAGIGAGAGAIAGGTTSRNYPGFHAFVGGAGGAMGGALVGAIVPIFQVIFQRGKIIYKR